MSPEQIAVAMGFAFGELIEILGKFPIPIDLGEPDLKRPEWWAKSRMLILDQRPLVDEGAGALTWQAMIDIQLIMHLATLAQVATDRGDEVRAEFALDAAEYLTHVLTGKLALIDDRLSEEG